LIRWLGESILYLSFFTNFVLLASFLGIGIGFMAHERRDWFRHLPIALLLLIAFVAVFRIEVDRSAADCDIHRNRRGCRPATLGHPAHRVSGLCLRYGHGC
jgi:hypothetical protein